MLAIELELARETILLCSSFFSNLTFLVFFSSAAAVASSTALGRSFIAVPVSGQDDRFIYT